MRLAEPLAYMKGETIMKKLISLILVLVLSLTAVSALAADALPSPNTLKQFGTSGEGATTNTPGIVIHLPVPQESKDLVNDLVKTGDLVENLYKKIIFVDNHADPTDQKELVGKKVTNIVIIPFPDIEVTDQVGDIEYAEIISPIPAAIAEYLLANEDHILAFFNYEVTQDSVEQLYAHEVKFEVRKNGDLTYGIVYKIPVEVLRTAQGWPTFMTFELVDEEAAK